MTGQRGYQVLARKYRPQRLTDLVGQDAMVRTLRNAFAHDRIAQAFILTGIRGTGKTSTARIIAKGMNCVGPDGNGGPTTEPCGVCEHCVAIAEGRHVDVLEMDAASRTGVGDIREIIESVHYRAASARYKIYIIDEVHMLSTNAFNALLKTLEEPPEHVKFLFATTEIRKVPVTVLSRCQRFDLRRIEPGEMMAMLARIAEAEGATVEEGALALITRAAEGSARDAQSLLDQAIAQGGGTTESVRSMLGLADRGRVLDLFERIMDGDAAGALAELSSQYAEGADPLAVLRDLAEVTHWLSVVKLTPGAIDDPTLSPDERTRGAGLSERLPMRALARAWQMLLKALEEVAAAPNAMMAAEMAVIRLTHVADLPTPEELVRKLKDAPDGPGLPPSSHLAPGRRESRDSSSGGPLSSAPASVATGPSAGARPLPGGTSVAETAEPGQRPEPESAAPPRSSTAARSAETRSHRTDQGADCTGSGAPRSTPLAASEGGNSAALGRGRPGRGGGASLALSAEAAPPLARFGTFAEVLGLIRAERDMQLLLEVEASLRLAAYTPGRIEFEPAPGAPPDLAQRLSASLARWTGARWAVTVVGTGGAPTVAEARRSAEAEEAEEARLNPLVQAVLEAFPGSRIATRRSAASAVAEASAEALDPGDEWDPLEG